MLGSRAATDTIPMDNKNSWSDSVRGLGKNIPSACGQTPLLRSLEKPYELTSAGSHQTLPPTACLASVGESSALPVPQFQ